MLYNISFPFFYTLPLSHSPSFSLSLTIAKLSLSMRYIESLSLNVFLLNCYSFYSPALHICMCYMLFAYSSMRYFLVIYVYTNTYENEGLYMRFHCITQ